MEQFLKNLIQGSRINPPQSCLDAFNMHFEGTVNTEWFKSDASFEAIFYKDNMEYIALFTPDGILDSYRMFLPVGYLPEFIKNSMESYGEIMNCVLINKTNTIEYEIIYRDKTMARHMIRLTGLGGMLDERPL